LKTDKFVDGGIIPDIAFQVGIGILPLLCRHAEHCHVQYVSFVGINDACLRLSNFRWDKVLLDGIGMYAVVDFRQFTLCRPAEQSLFFVF